MQRMKTANTYDHLNLLTGSFRRRGPQSLPLAGEGQPRLSDVAVAPSGASTLKYDNAIN
jgi:hypothetical protein